MMRTLESLVFSVVKQPQRSAEATSSEAHVAYTGATK